MFIERNERLTVGIRAKGFEPERTEPIDPGNQSREEETVRIPVNQEEKQNRLIQGINQEKEKEETVGIPVNKSRQRRVFDSEESNTIRLKKRSNQRIRKRERKTYRLCEEERPPSCAYRRRE